MNPERLILASTSPRRINLLKQIGLDFDVIDPGDVEISTDLNPDSRVKENAWRKAAVIAESYPQNFIIAADTIVVLNGEILEKPIDFNEANAMLRRLRGNSHIVISAVVLIHRGKGIEILKISQTIVNMKKINDKQIDAYVATGEPLDKAGAYAAQGVGAMLIESVNGCFYNVVGLPLSVLHDMFVEVGIKTIFEI